MRSLILLLTILACVLALVGSAPTEQLEHENVAAETLLDVDSGAGHSNQGLRKARQFYGYYGHPLYGGYYGGYGGYGFGWPYYGGYGVYYRPYYGGFYG